MQFWTLLRRSLLLRCPYCGQGKLFAGWLKMLDRCPNCGLKYEREPGFFLGSIYINYGLTALLVSVAYPVLSFNEIVPKAPLLFAAFVFVVLFPILFFRHARALWLGFDQWYDPRKPDNPPA